jgi:deazaflavin-dependent oxidoreductase (nitroreductase family)
MLIVAVIVIAAVVVGAHVLPGAHARSAPSDGSPQSGNDLHAMLGGTVLKAVGRTIEFLVRTGVPVGDVMLLTVRGRTTGRPRTNPVDLFRHGGGYWLIATHSAEANWVRNLRAAGEGTLTRGRRRLEFYAVEIPPDEAGAALMRIAGPRLARPVGGFVLRQVMGLAANAQSADFARAAASHPMFRLSIRGQA